MTVTEPLPGVYGRADWVDYLNYWREADAEWMQDRLVLRVVDEGDLEGLDHTPGGLVYNYDLDQLQLRSNAGGYKTLTPLPGTLQTAEAAGRTTIQHDDAGVGQGVVFSATEVEITDDFKVLGGVLIVNASGVSIKTGAKTAKLTTSDTNLVSDTPVSAPGVVITGGALSAAGRAATVGSLTVETSATVNGVLTAASATIGTSPGITLLSNKVTASGGYDSQSGSFYGDATSALMRHSSRTGPFVQTFATYINVGGGGMFDIYNQMRIITAAQGILHYQTGKNFAPSFYQSSPTPDVNAYPEGTIWIS